MPKIIIIAAALAACLAFTACKAGRNSDPGPLPDNYRQLVDAHARLSLDEAYLSRNAVIYPPKTARVPVDGEQVSGWLGSISFSLLENGKKKRVLHCYLINGGKVIAFPRLGEAAWCRDAQLP
jgi:hypothetical protein